MTSEPLKTMTPYAEQLEIAHASNYLYFMVKLVWDKTSKEGVSPTLTYWLFLNI